MIEFLHHSFTYVVPFLLILTVLVFVHEFGHYLIARWNGVRVEVFSIGFGTELFGWWDSAGTRWKFSTIPLGGYVKMFGDADASSGSSCRWPCRGSPKRSKMSRFIISGSANVRRLSLPGRRRILYLRLWSWPFFSRLTANRLLRQKSDRCSRAARPNRAASDLAT